MTRDSRYRWEFRVVALCPLNVRVDAVYYWGEDPKDFLVDRIPQVALALCDQVQVDTSTGEETDAPREKGLLKYIDAEFAEGNNYFADEHNNSLLNIDSFLGYEWNGVPRSWGNEIRNIYQQREKRKAQCPG